MEVAQLPDAPLAAVEELRVAQRHRDLVGDRGQHRRLAVVVGAAPEHRQRPAEDAVQEHRRRQPAADLDPGWTQRRQQVVVADLAETKGPLLERHRADEARAGGHADAVGAGHRRVLHPEGRHHPVLTVFDPGEDRGLT